MPISIRTVVVAALGVLLCGWSTPVAAQNPSRSLQGVFGGRPGVQPEQTFDLSLSILEAYDDNLLAEQGGVNLSAPAIGGWYTMFGADGAYERRGKKSQFGVTGGTSLRYYNESESFVASGALGIGFSTEFAKRTTLSANQGFAYSPSYLTGLFPISAPDAPGAAPPVGANYAVDDQSSFQYSTVIGLSHGLTRRGTLSGTLGYQLTDFIDDANGGREDQSNTLVRIQFSRGLTRYASLRVAYRYRNGNLGSGYVPSSVPTQTTTENGFDVGVDYTKPLSATRRMTIGFGVGSSGATLPDFPVVAANETQYNVIADASFAYQFQRSWEARANYRRGLEYVAELSQPVYTNGLAASVRGMLTPKMDLGIEAGYSRGASAVLSSASTYDTYTASARIRRSLTRTFAAYLEYIYYFYDFGIAQVQPGVPPTMERNGVRAGLTIWLPVIRR